MGESGREENLSNFAKFIYIIYTCMGGKTGETIVQGYIAVLVRCLGLMTVRKEGVEFFLRPQKFGKKLQRYFIHIVKKKKPRTWK